MNLSINFDEIRNIGNQLIQKAETFTSLVRNMSDINGQVSQVWTGTDASKYIGAVNEQAQYMMQLADTINVIGVYLVNVGNAYAQASENNANAVKY